MRTSQLQVTIMTTRPDVQAKRDKTYALRRTAVMKMHAEAAQLESQAAEILRTMTSMQASALSMMIRAALLREKARDA